ncbi:MAG: iron ABC transporter permease [Paracoccus sp. (in: a-proteobacteria)]|nr:iron ABC transporter permease [Paracoccus sp. (in: a-proteobacteria)]
MAALDWQGAPGCRDHLGRRAAILLAVLCLLVGALSLQSGAADLRAWPALWGALTGAPADPTAQMVMVQIRLPRLAAGMLIGASLAVAGVLMQGLFRNPLADPGLLGVSAGASLGAISAIVLGGTLPAVIRDAFGWNLVPVAAFAGGLAAMQLLYRIATRSGRTSVATMLLAGIALGAMVSALSGIVIFRATDSQLRDLTFWSLGSLAAASWLKLAAAAPLMIVALIAAFPLARGLNALALGEAVAAHVGTPVQAVKTRAILCAAALTGASVALAGGIGFIGIVAPHLLRLMIGPDHRWLLPGSALFGAALLAAADIASRTIVAPAELPIGILTAMIGGPFFLWILLSRRGGLDL